MNDLKDFFLRNAKLNTQKIRRALLRVDANIPLDTDGNPVDTYKLDSFLPTLEYLLNQNVACTIISHCGRPTEYDPALSLFFLHKWLLSKGFGNTDFYAAKKHETLNDYLARISYHSPITLLDNLRFFEEEKALSAPAAHALMHNHDIFVQDGWGVLHRSTTTTVTIPTLYQAQSYLGFLVEDEIKSLNKLRNQECALIIGGGKPETKRDIVVSLIKKGVLKHAYILPALSSETFSDINNDSISLPDDFYVSSSGAWEGPYYYTSKPKSEDFIISQGKKTSSSYQARIKAYSYDYILINGPACDIRFPGSCLEYHTFLRSLGDISIPLVSIGGDTQEHLRATNLFDTCITNSTGGGASLAYLVHDEIPGLKAFLGNRAE